MRRTQPDCIRTIVTVPNGLCCLVLPCVVSQLVSFGCRRQQLHFLIRSRIIKAVSWDFGLAFVLEARLLAVFVLSVLAPESQELIMSLQAINLGLNAKNNQAGKVSYRVYEAFIALQALGPFVGLLVNKPEQVERKDGVRVELNITNGIRKELLLTAKRFFSKEFLLIVPLIGQGIYTEAVMFTFESLWFSVRGRALGSFLSGIVAIIAGNLLGAYLDLQKLTLKTRARTSFFTVLGLQGIWWIWATILVTDFNKSKPTFDWVDPGFGKSFALFLFWVAGFQVNYLY